jgi:hypothetical protein
MDSDAIDRVVRKYAGELGLDRGYSAHSMRATFITPPLEDLDNGLSGDRRPPPQPPHRGALHPPLLR